MDAKQKKSKKKVPEGKLLHTVLCKGAQTEVFSKWRLSCVRCQEVVNPTYFMICEKNGHFMCGRCAWLNEPRPKHYLCCDPENLRKGPPAWLEKILQGAQWQCVYKENGCEEMPNRKDWQKHVNKCIYKCDITCFYKNCNAIFHGGDETVKHYKEKHMLIEMAMKGSKIKLDLLYDRCEDGVKRRLTLLKDGKKYYIVGTEVTEEEFNIFIWDCAQKETYKPRESGRQYKLVLIPFPEEKSSSVGLMTYHGLCQPMMKTPEEIIEKGDGFSISRSRLMKKYLGAHPACSDLDLCKIVVNLETGEDPEPNPQLPAALGDDSDEKMRLLSDYARTLFPQAPPRDGATFIYYRKL